jgi:hypothetical protein
MILIQHFNPFLAADWWMDDGTWSSAPFLGTSRLPACILYSMLVIPRGYPELDLSRMAHGTLWSSCRDAWVSKFYHSSSQLLTSNFLVLRDDYFITAISSVPLDSLIRFLVDFVPNTEPECTVVRLNDVLNSELTQAQTFTFFSPTSAVERRRRAPACNSRVFCSPTHHSLSQVVGRSS